ncbi:sensor histidine kinase [Psychromonas sp. CD1]|uniref:sensor histidine kinase n=1 Tax=Psychromonas sp. CD1 TaxID=1979839 RepID=UPI000B9B568C|nr:ATP-binding protein [Psychromonas sp. CD1]
MRSIKQSLVKKITVMIACIFGFTFFIIDQNIDNLALETFESSLIEKSNYMKSLAYISDSGLSFNLKNEYLTEFSSAQNTQYFQLWHKKTTIRSASLQVLPDVDLFHSKIPLDNYKIYDVTLPDGRAGKSIVCHFSAQKAFFLKNKASSLDTSVYMTLAVPASRILFIEHLIDAILLASFFLSVLFMRYALIHLITQSLFPLFQLIEQLKSIDISAGRSKLPDSTLKIEEIEPIRADLNHFIQSNYNLLKKEKRLGADIAHELKTPIAELISLSEILIKYPDEPCIASTYKEDVLNISLKMKGLVNNLLLLHQSASPNFSLSPSELSLPDFISTLLRELAFKYSNIKQRITLLNKCAHTTIHIDTFSLHIILINLLDNALFYSPNNSKILFAIIKNKKNQIEVSIENELVSPFVNDELIQLNEPLFRVDNARNTNNRHGLGLSIVQNICDRNKLALKITQKDNLHIKFSFSLNKK